MSGHIVYSDCPVVCEKLWVTVGLTVWTWRGCLLVWDVVVDPDTFIYETV